MYYITYFMINFESNALSLKFVILVFLIIVILFLGIFNDNFFLFFWGGEGAQREYFSSHFTSLSYCLFIYIIYENRTTDMKKHVRKSILHMKSFEPIGQIEGES